MGASLKSKTRLTLQDEYEKILQQLKHHALGEDESTESISSPVSSSSDLATDLEIQILKRISEILCSNDCLDICIDIFEGFCFFSGFEVRLFALFPFAGHAILNRVVQFVSFTAILDMFDSLKKIKTEFIAIFEGEAGLDICTRYRELEKLLVHSSSKVF
ncbi:hypothetical protein LINPERHAP2_LOCUS35643 [Linum perenne]